MYHGAHWRCEPARAERMTVEDPASTEDPVPQGFQKFLITRSVLSERSASSANSPARDA